MADTTQTVIVAGVFGLLGSILTGLLNLRNERNKNEASLLLEALKTGDTKTAARNLLFLSEAKLIRLSPHQVKALEEERGSSILPVLPPSGTLERFAPVATDAHSPELNAVYITLLHSFQNYLRISGYDIKKGGEIKFEVVPGNTIDGEWISSYDPETEIMQVASKYAVNTDYMLHEYMRHVLIPPEEVACDPDDNPRWWGYLAVQSGLAIYCPCSFKDNPVFGEIEGESTELKNEATFGEIPTDQDAADLEGNTAWGGAFWELRQLLGDIDTDRLLAKTWIEWHPADPDEDMRVGFVREIIKANQSGGGRRENKIKTIFKQRGLVL
jgi:hypothetical protein